MKEYPDFPEAFRSSPNPACLWAPVRSKTGKLVDLRFLCFNESLPKHFKNSELLHKLDRLSDFELPYFDRVLALCEKTLLSGRPRKLRLFVETVMRPYLCLCYRTEAGNIIIAASGASLPANRDKPQGAKNGNYENFFNSGPSKLVIDPSTGRIIEANTPAAKYYGWNRSKLRLMTIYQIDAGPAEIIAASIEAIQNHGYVIFHVQHRRACGDIRNVEIHSAQGFWENLSVHFAIILDCSTVGTFASAAMEAAPEGRSRPTTKDCFSPFLGRYERDMPYLGDMMAALIPHGRLAEYRAGEHFLEFGETSPKIGFIIKGYFRQYTITAKGIDCTLALYRMGQILDSSAYFRLGRESPIALEALTECEVFITDLRYLRSQADKDPRWFKLLYYNLSSRLVAKQKRDISLLCDDATTRYRRFLVADRDALPYLRSYHIASYLGVTSETLSRIRKRASEKGPFKK